MAISIVHSAKTGAGANSTLTITSATAGNTLICFANQSVSVLPTTGSDNISGSTGWTTAGTGALFNTNTRSLYVMAKTAVGGETSLTPTVGTGGTMQALAYWELAGATTTVDNVIQNNNIASNTTATSSALITTNAGDIILVAVAQNGNSGTINAWTGTGPMTNIDTVSSRIIGGSYIPGTTLSSVTFTANWTTANLSAVLAVAFTPASTPSVNISYIPYVPPFLR